MEKFKPDKRPEPDSYIDWLTNSSVNICPHSISTDNTKYWCETIDMCDGEHGLTVPDGMIHTPSLFFQALGIIREARYKVKKTKGN